MGVFDPVLSEDIVLDEAAFDQAIREFSELAGQLSDLRSEIEQMLTTLRAGFDTPAGRKFISSCEKNLFEPLDAQKLVLDHISETLAASRQAYESVFREYEALQAQINSASF